MELFHPGCPAIGRQAFFSTPTPRTRKIAMRSAITLSPDRGSIFDILLNLVRWRLGRDRWGAGQQFVSWIHDSRFSCALWIGLFRMKISPESSIFASPNPLPNQRFHASFSCGLGRAHRLARVQSDDRGGLFSNANRIRAGVKEPTRYSRALCSIPALTFLFPDWPDCGSRSRRSLERRIPPTKDQMRFTMNAQDSALVSNVNRPFLACIGGSECLPRSRPSQSASPWPFLRCIREYQATCANLHSYK